MSFFPKLSKAGLLTLIAGLALVVIIGLATFNRVQEKRHPELAQAAPPVPVRVETAAESVFQVERSWRGSLEVEQRATLSAQLSANVLELPFREGERVEAGSVVFRLDDAELVSEQARLQAVSERIDGELETARHELARQQELFSRELASERLLEQTAQQVSSLAAQQREAEANLNLVRTRLAYTVGRAPFDARIQQRFVKRGELARQGSPIIELVADQQLEAVVHLPQTDAAGVQPGLPVTIHVPAIERQWEARIDRVYPALAPNTRSATLAVLIPEQNDDLKPGMAVIVRGRVLYREDAISVPAQAVHEDQSASWLYLADGDRARRRSVQTGPGSDGRVLIEEGLTVGDIVITTADPRLGHEVSIRVAQEAPGP